MAKRSAHPKSPPLHLVPFGARSIVTGVDMLEHDDGSGVVFLWGMASWCWSSDDVAARRLAAVQMAESGAASVKAVAVGFGIEEPTLWRWRDTYRRNGIAGLLPKKMGPKRASKLTEDTLGEIAQLRNKGLSLRSIGERVGISHDSVKRALKSSPVISTPQLTDTALVPLAIPKDRGKERKAASEGMLLEAAPVVCQGASLPLVGSLAILPGLVPTGLLDAFSSVYGHGRNVGGSVRAAFYGLRSLVCVIVFSLLLGEPRAEGLTRLDPVAIGRLLGLDRAPEVSRLRFRLRELAREERSDKLIMSLAQHHIESRPSAVGLLYVDGHVRAYHGKAEISKAHVARMRLAMPAEIDTWICDRFGDGLLVWQAPVGASLANELRLVATKVRSLLGEDAHPTICFDRGGWSPKLFCELIQGGFDILTYRKGPVPAKEREAFRSYSFTDELGRCQNYLLADEKIVIGYDRNRMSFDCRQITRLDEQSGHQTQIITTRDDSDPALLAYAMFSRWRQENFFRYLRTHYGLDALDAYETTPDDPDRLVANPARRDANRLVKQSQEAIVQAQAMQGRMAIENREITPETAATFADADAELKARKSLARSIPSKVPLGEVRPDAVRLGTERKRIIDAIRMATYNAESALVRMIAPHYARAEDEARSLLREIFKSSADLEIEGTTLHVRIEPLSAPRRTRALEGLCQELTATKTTYPGTNLTLAYSVKER